MKSSLAVKARLKRALEFLDIHAAYKSRCAPCATAITWIILLMLAQLIKQNKVGHRSRTHAVSATMARVTPPSYDPKRHKSPTLAANCTPADPRQSALGKGFSGGLCGIDDAELRSCQQLFDAPARP